MQVCRHCGWENPEIAAFCTNCGTGIGRDRSSGPRFRALGLTPGRSAEPADLVDNEWPAAATPGGGTSRTENQSVLSQTLVDFTAPALGEANPQPLRARPLSEPPLGERPQRTEEMVSPGRRRAADGALVAPPITGDHAAVQRRSTGPMLMPDEADISIDQASDTQVMKTVRPGASEVTTPLPSRDDANGDTRRDPIPPDDVPDAPDDDQPDSNQSDSQLDSQLDGSLLDGPPDDDPSALADATADPADAHRLDDEVSAEPTADPAADPSAEPTDDALESDDDATANTDPPEPGEPPADSLEEDGFDEFVDPSARGGDSVEQDDVVSSIDEPGAAGDVEIEVPDDDRLADAIDAFARDGDVRIPPPSDSPFEPEDELELSTSDLHAVDFESRVSEPPQPIATSPSLRAVPPPLPPADIPRFVLRPFSQTLSDRKIVPVGDTPVTIGREDSDIRISDDLFVSPRHARFSVRDNALWIEDLESLNGVWRRVRTDALLRAGDQLLIGQQILRVEASPGRINGIPPADGTQRFGPPPERSRYRILQIAADGEPLDIYHVPTAGCRLGRRLGDLVFTDDTYMSGTHALLVPEDEHLKICDLSSRNGCWLRLRDHTALQVGDAVMIGRTVWRIGRPV